MPHTCSGGKIVAKIEIQSKEHIQLDTGDIPPLDHRCFITPKEFRECLEGTYFGEIYDGLVTLHLEKEYEQARAELIAARTMCDWMKGLERDAKDRKD